MTIEELHLDEISLDDEIQPRVTLDGIVTSDYAEAIRRGEEFPPTKAFHDGQVYWLADGYHRWNAAAEAGLEMLIVDVEPGTRRDAILYAASANTTHGLRRTNADKRRAVELLLRDPEWSQWSDREIARQCGVSDRFVNKVRDELSPTANSSQSVKRIGRDGRTIDVTNIGKSSRTESQESTDKVVMSAPIQRHPQETVQLDPQREEAAVEPLYDRVPQTETGGSGKTNEQIDGDDTFSPQVPPAAQSVIENHRARYFSEMVHLKNMVKQSPNAIWARVLAASADREDPDELADYCLRNPTAIEACHTYIAAKRACLDTIEAILLANTQVTTAAASE